MLKDHRNVGRKSVTCSVITVSDTRTEETDKSGQLIKQFLAETEHTCTRYTVVRDEKREIEDVLKKSLENPDVEAIIINGGTGIAARDVTIEVVQSVLDKELPGFGEIFRYLSYRDDIGSAAILSRATAGIANNTAVFSIPGSSGAVKLAMEQLIIPEIGHIVGEVQKDL